MDPEQHVAFVVTATLALLALAVAVYSAIRIEAMRRDKKPCDRLHVADMQDHGLSVVVGRESPHPTSPQYLSAEDLPPMRGPVPEYVDVDSPPPTRRSAT